MHSELFCQNYIIYLDRFTDCKIIKCIKNRHHKQPEKNDEAELSKAIKQNKNCAHYGKSLMRTLFKDYIKVVCSDELCEMRNAMLRNFYRALFTKPNTK